MFREAPEFTSYRGLYRTAFNHSELLLLVNHLVELVRYYSNITGAKTLKPEVRLLDTFFSDTLEEAHVADIVRLCRDFSSPLRILILNPHSSFAIARGKSLRVNPLSEVNRAIMKLRRAVSNVRDKPNVKLVVGEEEFHSSDFLQRQLDQLQDERGEVSVSVRFYEVMTETPIYIISNFAAKGLIIDHHSAAYNPWMVFLDNPYQDGDIFDCLKKSFDTIWDNSSAERPLVPHLIPVSRLGCSKVFLSQAHGSSDAQKVKKYIEQTLGLKVMDYTDSAVPGKGPFENLETMASQCGYAVVVLTRDDEVATGRTNRSVGEGTLSSRKRGRQNVIHEIGYCQGKMGAARVLILFEDGVEKPSNFGYLHGQQLQKEALKRFSGSFRSTLMRMRNANEPS